MRSPANVSSSNPIAYVVARPERSTPARFMSTVKPAPPTRAVSKLCSHFMRSGTVKESSAGANNGLARHVQLESTGLVRASCERAVRDDLVERITPVRVTHAERIKAGALREPPKRLARHALNQNSSQYEVGVAIAELAPRGKVEFALTAKTVSASSKEYAAVPLGQRVISTKLRQSRQPL